MVKPMKKETVALIQRGCDRKKAVEGGSGMSGVKPVLLLRRERILCGQEVNMKSLVPPGGASDHTCASQSAKDLERHASPPWRGDDKDGHYKFELGESLTSRYKIHSKMGTFGQVLECWDREREEMVAIKIVRGINKYREAAMIEINMLQQLGKYDKNASRLYMYKMVHSCSCVQILELVFEKLGPSLYDFLKTVIAHFQLILSAIMHDMRLIHTDLKPENILLVSSRSPKQGSYFKRLPKSSAIKVIDFGSTTYDRCDNSYVVSTRHYRAPEDLDGAIPVIFGAVGETLFQTHENLEHLAMMERVLGPLPSNMLRLAARDAERYVRRGRLNWPECATSKESMKANLVMQHMDHSAGEFIDLLQGLLRYDPANRLAANAALLHPFFTRNC
ncbi:Quinolinate synthetase A protein [Musa troglodytarum]|uniref:Quinolinate synthetase A protein n=1 Tax=Musa troglodytarum TaxID=320322 RepID=A0A9E7L5J9_9LILI|nr:Quinolinate synthetase A protein [Musa troglodytarum]